MPTNYVCELNWEALATFSVGLMTVAAAVFVARRQMAISAQQNEILRMQASIQQQAQRAELFDRRFAIYQSIVAFAETYMALGHSNWEDIQDRFVEVSARWKHARHQAQFLFGPEVRDALSEIVVQAIPLEDLAGPNMDPNSPIGQDFARRASALSARLHSLADRMGNEMRLFEG